MVVQEFANVSRVEIKKGSHSPAVDSFLESEKIDLIEGVSYPDIDEFLKGLKVGGARTENYGQCDPFDRAHLEWAKETLKEVGLDPKKFGSNRETFVAESRNFYSHGFARGLSFSGRMDGVPIGVGLRDIRPRVMVTDDAGSPWVDVDPQLMREGDACFTSFSRRSKARGRVLSIVTITGGHCGLSGEQLFWSPLLGCRILELARASGIPARLEYLNICQHSGGNYGYYKFPVCEADEPVVYESALAIGQGGLFRTLGFMGIMGLKQHVGTGLGYPGPGVSLMKKMARHHDKEAIAAMFPDGCVFVDQVTDEASAEKELNRVLALIGEGLFRDNGVGIFA